MTAPATDLFPETQLEPELVPDERYTPSALYLPLHREFSFDLDVCATAESAKCIRFFCAPHGGLYDGEAGRDGLAQDWIGSRAWCNPPYSNIGAWVEKAWVSRAELVVMLLPAWTDRDWWLALVEPFRDGRSPIPGPTLTTRFLRGRIRFGFPGNPEGIGQGSPNFGSVLLIWKGGGR